MRRPALHAAGRFSSVRLAPALLAALLAFAGCVGAPAGDAPGTSGTPATAASPSASPTPTVSAVTARERAIDAEKARIRGALDHENVTDLSFGVLRPAEAEVVERNATGAVVAVTVGYSVEINGACSLDGAATKTRYAVSKEETRLLAVGQDVTGVRRC